jgi:hypothetical protein
LSSNVRDTPGGMQLRNSRLRHIAIGVGRDVWHYSNFKEEVVIQSLDSFPNHYSGDTVMIYGDFVLGTLARHYGTSPHPTA